MADVLEYSKSSRPITTPSTVLDNSESNLTASSSSDSNDTSPPDSPGDSDELIDDNERNPSLVTWPQRASGDFLRNAVLPVCLNEASEGVILANFTYKGGEYQGVLLQINRKHGIPSGIPIPEGLYSDPPPEEVYEVPPLNERIIYNQGNGSGPKPRPKRRPPVRRIPKKGRKRGLPIFCERCRQSCDDKPQPQKPTPVAKEKKVPKPPPPPPIYVGGVTTRRQYANTLQKEAELKEAERQAELNSTKNDNKGSDEETSMSDQFGEEEPPFTSVGNQGLVDSYWKRASPLKPKFFSKEPALVPKIILNKAEITVAEPTEGSTHSSSESSSNGQNDSSKYLSSSDTASQSLPAVKRNNLASCINKIKLLNEGEGVPLTSRPNENPRAKSRRCITPPKRYRDDTYLTSSDILVGKRQRVEETVDDSSPLCGTATTDVEGQNASVHYEDCFSSSSCAYNTDNLEEPQRLVNDKSQIASSFTFSTNSNSTSNIACPGPSRGKELLTAHLIATSSPAATFSPKTPALKITFESPGGTHEILQIPKGTFQKYNISENNDENHSKISRKSKKKSKRAKKRSGSSLREPYTGLNKHTTASLDGINSSSSTGRETRSPSPPVLKRESPYPSQSDYSVNESGCFNAVEGPSQPPPAEKMEPTCRARKAKRKKIKKKKKSKSKGAVHQRIENLKNENDDSSSVSSVDIPPEPDVEQLKRLYNRDKYKSAENLPVSKDASVDSDTPHSSNCSTDSHERLFLSLKRQDSNPNAYVSCNKVTTAGPSNESACSSSTTSASATSSTRAERRISSASSSKNKELETEKKRGRLQSLKKNDTEASSNEAIEDANPENNAGENEDGDVNDSTIKGNEGTMDENIRNVRRRNKSDQTAGDDFANFDPSKHEILEMDYFWNGERGDGSLTYRKGDIVWGKIRGCSWWPGKIAEILYVDRTHLLAIIEWYQSLRQSYVSFSNVLPFDRGFNTKYNSSKSVRSYKQAVRQALIEAHSLNPEDLPDE